jgi:hypothetical protein
MGAGEHRPAWQIPISLEGIMGFITDIQNRVYSKTGLFTTWLPTDIRRVGEYGTIRDGRFVSEGSLDRRGVQFSVETAGAHPSRLGFSDRVRFHATGSGSAKLEHGNQVGAAAIAIDMEKKGAFVYQLQNIATQAPADKHDFYAQLGDLVMSGKIHWDEDTFVLVEEVRHAESAAIIVLESDSGKIVLHGNMSGAIQDESAAPLAQAGGKIAAEVERGSIFHAVGETSITPLIQLTSLTFGIDPNPNSPLNGLKAITDWWRREVLGRAMPHDINVRQYVEDPKSVRYDYTVPGSAVRLSMVAKTLDFDALLARSQTDDDAAQLPAIKKVQAGTSGNRMRAAG